MTRYQRLTNALLGFVCVAFLADVVTLVATFTVWAAGGFIWPRRPGLLAVSVWGIPILALVTLTVAYMGEDADRAAERKRRRGGRDLCPSCKARP